MANDRLRDEPSDLRRVALALAMLALVGFSLVLTCQMSSLSLALRTAFANHNVLGVPGRLQLLLSLAAGLVVPAAAGLLVLWRKRDIAALERAATLSSPLGLAFLVPGLFLSEVATEKPLFYLVVLASFGVVESALLADALALLAREEPRPFRLWWRRLPLVQRVRRLSLSPWASLALLALCSAGYVTALGGYGVAHHRLIQDVPTDWGIADNVMFNLLHGRWFVAPAEFGTAPGDYLALHPEYGSLLFVPLYALRPGVETLIWLQASIAALAVVPLYLVAARQLGRKLAVWVGVAYLLLAPLHGALMVGFTWMPAVTLFLFSLYYAVESKRLWLFVLALLGLLSISEAGPLYAFALGLMLIASRTRLRVGLWLTTLAVPVIVFNLLLSVRGSSAQTPPLLAALTTFWNNPIYFLWDLARFVKVASVLHALSPLCLLPVSELACWPLLIPGLLFTSLGSAFWPNGGTGFVNGVIWVPGCFIALLFALKKRRAQGFGRPAYRAAIFTLTITLLSHSYDFGAFLRADGFGGLASSAVRMTPWGQSRYESLRRVLARIPASASVGTTTYLVSFVSNRRDVFELTRPYAQPDYILLSSRESSYIRDRLANTFAAHEYRLVLSTFDEFYLFARGAETQDTRSALLRLGLTN